MKKTAGLSLILMCLAGGVGASGITGYGDFSEDSQQGRKSSTKSGNGLTVQLNPEEWGTGRVAMTNSQGDMESPDVIEDKTVNPESGTSSQFNKDD